MIIAQSLLDAIHLMLNNLNIVNYFTLTPHINTNDYITFEYVTGQTYESFHFTQEYLLISFHLYANTMSTISTMEDQLTTALKTLSLAQYRLICKEKMNSFDVPVIDYFYKIIDYRFLIEKDV